MTSPHTANILSAVNDIIVGKHQTSRLALTCLLAQGHLLIEDLPGVGKTTLAHTLAKVLGLDFQRLQFTSDMLPADILGVSIFDRDGQQFHFHPGPIFSQLILADEVNRATPRTQSALLEAMEERQISIEGQTHSLPTPFFVIATQNPSHQIGTFPLPESQLDRFLMRLAMGYPDAESERQLLSGTSRQQLLQQLKAIIDPAALTALQDDVSQVHTSPALVDYVQKILAFSRDSGLYEHGLSPRAGLGLIRAAQAWAFIAGRQQTLPEDIQSVLPAVVNHRLQARDGDAKHDFSASLVAQVPIP
ncbi:MAG: MoxR family ATPase [Piscirickettsiaceae bacterium]|jgi:MoxR-like ATPase|nr:MoxR family ATPase [Piscirickettsiaceae bacterium]